MIACLTSAALLCLAPSAQSDSDVLLKLEGFVGILNGPVSGPFAGAQPGDTYTLLVELDEDLAGPFGVGTALYALGALELRIGSTVVEFDAAPQTACSIGNDVAFPGFPRVDYIAVGKTLGPGQELFATPQDATGQLFTSNQLSTQAGTYFLPSESTCTLTDAITGGGLDLAPDTLEIIPRAPVGVAFCASAAPNSTGLPGRLTATGYTVAAVNELSLVAEDLPVGQATLLLTSQIQTAPSAIPNSQGLLCIGLPIGRYVKMVTAADPMGVAVFPIDLARTPTPNGLVTASAGETWRFQAWHRDVSPLGGTSNVTTGVAVTLR